MKFSILKPILVASVLALSTGIISCSTKPTTVAQKTVQMPTEYPTTASQSLLRLNEFVPKSSEVLIFSSYGSIADAVVQFDKWNVVDHQEITNLLNDLGTHYLLNPSKLQSWFKAGFHTGSGFTAGIFESNAFVVFDLISVDDFRTWWDNFMNEEFGRPRYSEERVNGKTFVKIHILNRDFATLIIDSSQPVTVVFGDGMVQGSPDSAETAKKLIQSEKLTDEEAQKIAKQMGSSPFGVWAKTSGSLSEKLPANLQFLKDWCDSAAVELNFSAKGPEIHVSGIWQDSTYNDVARGRYISTFFKGNSGGKAASILETKPTSVFRILLDPESIESFVLPYAGASQRSKYADLKDKLTQRLLNLNIEDQIIYNMGAAWAAVYDAQDPHLVEPSLTEILSAQKAAVFIPFKEASKSNAFFAKVNVLKKFVPEDKAVINMEDGILHATTKLSGQTLHVGYADGLLAVATNSAWENALAAFKSADKQVEESPISLDNHAIAAQIQVADVTTILGVKYAIVKEQIGNFLKPFNHFEMQLSTSDERFVLSGKGVLK